MTTGSTAWGQSTGVIETNTRTFSGNWTGTGTISGSGDNEEINLNAGEYMTSEIVNTGAIVVALRQNFYKVDGDDVTLYYRTAATEGGITSATWTSYTEQFTSLGYIQIKLEDPIIKASSNGRYLFKDGLPWLMIGASPQGMLVALSTAEMDTYFSTRAGQGFNCAQVHIVAGTSFGGVSNTTYETYDGIKPFSTNGDISTVNGTYFARLDTLISTAATYGITIMMSCADMIDADHLWKTNGNTKCYNYGAYLGNRYKGYENIIWMVGNDFQDWTTDTDSLAALINILNGIQSADANHTLYTAWLDYLISSSRESEDFDAEVTLDFAYTYYVAYDLIATERALVPAKPVFLGETYYEGYDYGGSLPAFTNKDIRKQNYWSMLEGACGITYSASDCNFPANWEDLIILPGATEVGYLDSLFQAYQWWNLVPDLSHTILTAGYGTKATGTTYPMDSEYVGCAYISGVSLAIIYMPSNRTMTVDMSQFDGTVTCRWYDPTDGSYTTDAASPHANSGSHNFSRATANSDGGSDWVLVLDT